MALQKTKTLQNGASGNYWKIMRLSLDKRNMKLNCSISLFTAQANADTPPRADLGVTKAFSFPVEANVLSGDLVALAYSLIKAKNDPDLVNAINV